MCAEIIKMANYLKRDPYREPQAFMNDIVDGMKEIFNLRVAEVKQEVAAKLAEVDATLTALNERPESTAADVRMAALHLAQHMVPADGMIDFADALAQYVLTGKKPGAEG